MKRLLIVLAFLATSLVSYAGWPTSAGAAAELRPYSAAVSEAKREWTRPGSDSRPAITTIKLANGNTVQVDVCDEGIFRVRISPRKEFEESLMERYGCLKTDWAPVKTTQTTKGGEWTVSTGKYSLSVKA